MRVVCARVRSHSQHHVMGLSNEGVRGVCVVLDDPRQASQTPQHNPKKAAEPAPPELHTAWPTRSIECLRSRCAAWGSHRNAAAAAWQHHRDASEQRTRR